MTFDLKVNYDSLFFALAKRSCPKCGGFFPENGFFKKHISHCQNFDCEFCGLGFDNVSELILHVLSSHSDVGKSSSNESGTKIQPKPGEIPTNSDFLHQCEDCGSSPCFCDKTQDDEATNEMEYNNDDLEDQDIDPDGGVSRLCGFARNFTPNWQYRGRSRCIGGDFRNLTNVIDK